MHDALWTAIFDLHRASAGSMRIEVDRVMDDEMELRVTARAYGYTYENRQRWSERLAAILNGRSWALPARMLVAACREMTAAIDQRGTWVRWDGDCPF